MHVRLVLPALLAFAAAALPAADTVVQPASPSPATESRTVELRAGAPLKIRNLNGDIRVEAWDREQVAWTGAFKASGQGEHAKVVFSGGREGLEIRGEYPKAKGSGGRSAQVQMGLKVPRRVAAELQTTNGALVLRGTEGPAELGTVNGSVKVEDVKGRLHLRTVNGAIEGRLDASGQALKAETVNGAIRLQAAGLKGRLKASTVNGSLKVQTRGAEDVQATRRTLSARFPGSDQELHLSTVNGSITLE